MFSFSFFFFSLFFFTINYLQPKVRYTDTSYIIAQQWEKGREKNTFPNVYAFEYNRQKFENLAKCDERQTNLSLTLPLPIPVPVVKTPKRPLPVPPPLPPVKRNEENENVTESAAAAADAAIEGSSNGETRNRRRRKTRSLERLRDQPNEIELSDSDEEVVNKVAIPIITANDCTTITGDAFAATIDEPDASVASVTITDTIHINSNTTGGDEPAICVDTSIVVCNDATVSDRSQISYDEILKIEESLDEDAENDHLNFDLNEMNQSIVVDIHNEPIIELKIHEDGDSDKEIPISGPMQCNFTKEYDAQIEQDRCHSEDDTIGRAEDSFVEKPERLVQSDSELLEKTPLELVVECDINENVVILSQESKAKSEIVDFDHNHNDIVKTNEFDGSDTTPTPTPTPTPAPISDNSTVDGKHAETNLLVEKREIVQPNELHRISNSSRSSFNESDGFDSEPMYATVDTALQMVSFYVQIEKKGGFLV